MVLVDTPLSSVNKRKDFGVVVSNVHKFSKQFSRLSEGEQNVGF